MTGDIQRDDDGRARESSDCGRTGSERAASATESHPGEVVTDGGFDAGFFETVVEQVGVGVGVYESDGRYAYVNEAYADMLGMDRTTLHGKPVWEVNPSLERAQFDDYWASFDLGETRQRETVHTDSDGTEFPVETHTTAIEVDETQYHVGTIADISERIEGWERLERQDERLEQFASVVSHDLRNPLNVAMGRLQLAQDTTDAEHLDHVGRSLERMETLIDDVLTMARDGNRITDPEPVDVERVVDRAWRTVRTDGATLSVEDDLGTILSDESRLVEIFENLFGNAVTHVGPDVSVRVGRTEDGLFVADDGPGIDPSEREDAMDYGYSTAEQANGFGLTIVDQIATAHEWSVSLTESDDGGLRVDLRGVDFE